MSLKSRAWAGFGSAALAGMVLAPAAGAATSSNPTPPGHHTSRVSLSGVPTFPGLDASAAVLQAWAQQLSAKYHLPTPPGPGASETQLMAYGQQVMTALHLPPFPSENASDAEVNAWLNKVTAALGLPPMPGMNASDAAWQAWLTKAFGISPQQLVNKIGAVGHLGNVTCINGTPKVAVAAVNLSNAPVVIAEFVDGKPANAAVRLKSSPLSADEPTSYRGYLPVPAGKHKISLVNMTTGKTLDMTVTSGCSTKPAPTGIPPMHGGGVLPRKPVVHPSQPGPVVQTDDVKTNETSGMLAFTGAAILLAGSGAALARSRRR